MKVALSGKEMEQLLPALQIGFDFAMVLLPTKRTDLINCSRNYHRDVSDLSLFAEDPSLFLAWSMGPAGVQQTSCFCTLNALQN